LELSTYTEGVILGPEFYGNADNPLAIVIRRDFSVVGIEFFSPPSFSQQLGLMTRPTGYRVPAHRHNSVSRTISVTQEVLFIRSGNCQVNLFNENNESEYAIELSSGDVILLAHGGHEVIMLSDCEILEVKQGPYAGNQDKTPFEPVNL
jgi:hypothetical protein